MVNVRDIANWFLSRNDMTHKKLQKLCYYAQAWYCALYDGTPLFDDEIQAWVHGPVIPALYPVYGINKYKAGLSVYETQEEIIKLLNNQIEYLQGELKTAEELLNKS